MIRIGLLGSGTMAAAHTKGLKSNRAKAAKMTGVYSAHEARRSAFASEHGIRAYDSLEQMLSDGEIDMIDVCAPSWLNEECCLKIAEAKKHIFLEKPIAFTMEAAKRIIGAAEKNGVRLMVGQVLRFWPEYVKLKELCDAGTLGDIRDVYAARLRQPPEEAWYQDPQKSGGTLLNLMVHDIDFLHHMLGKPVSVYSVGTDGCGGVMGIFRFVCGANAALQGSLSMAQGYPFTAHMRVAGTKATAEFIYKAGESIYTDATTSLVLCEPGKEPQNIKTEHYDPYGREVEYFCECIEQGKRTDIVTNESVLSVLSSMLAAKQSMQDNLVHTINSFIE
jgi:predicted dehydrogenase